MMGVQTFPTPLEGHSLQDFKDFVNKYQNSIFLLVIQIIWIQTMVSKIIPITAYSLGADMIEKHFTDNRKKKIRLSISYG